MFDEILVCLDGSPLAEKILPLAQGICKRQGLDGHLNESPWKQ